MPAWHTTKTISRTGPTTRGRAGIARPASGKRHALQDLGEELIAAPDELLDRLGLPERLADAIREARRITSRSAMVRQRQFIGKLMRGIDPDPVRAALAARGAVDRAAAARFQRIEQWRDRLLAEGDTALAALLAEHPSRALLAALAAKAIDERAPGDARPRPHANCSARCAICWPTTTRPAPAEAPRAHTAATARIAPDAAGNPVSGLESRHDSMGRHHHGLVFRLGDDEQRGDHAR